MNLEDLRAVQAEERSTDSLQALRDAFYREAAAFIEDRRAERDRAAADVDDPFRSEDVRRLTDEIETAEEVVEAIYERRVGKLVRRASLAAAGMSVDEEGLTDEEAALFRDLVAAIEENRRDVLASIAGGDGSRDGPGDDGAPASGAGDPGAVQVSDPPIDGSGAGGSAGAGGDPPDDPGPADEGSDRVTLRVTEDVGEVFGVDERTYDLAAEDVVTLPAPNARPLLDGGAAERLD